MKPVTYDVLMAISGAIRNQTYDRCSRWGSARRTMQDGSAYSIPDYPYIEGILDSCAKRNWIMKPAQVGLTEGGITISYFVADYDGRDVIYYFPTKKMAERFSKTRFTPAINLSEYLSRACTNNSIEIKQFGNATIHILGAGSVADLRGTSSGRLIFDELDLWTDQQIYQAEQRSRGQKNDDVIIWGFSTPIYPNNGVHKQFLKSTQEHYFFECPHCNEHVTLGRSDDQKSWLESFELCGTTVDDSAVHNSHLKCRKCQSRLEHKDKLNWLAGGYWASIDADGNPVDPDPNLFKTSRGFYLNQLYSPTVEPYVIALDFLRSHGDEQARREFYNSVLGLPFIEDCVQVTDQQIDDAIHKGGTFSMIEARPLDVSKCFVTLGVDQGGPIHHWAAVDWKFDNIVGDPNDRATGRMIGCGRVLQDDWDGIYALMRAYLVRMCVIDFYPQPSDARTFARKFPEYVWLCQYNTGRGGGREIRLTEDDYGANLVKCDDVGWMSKTLGRLMSGGLSLPLDLPLEFRQQIKSPVRTLKKVGGIYVAEYTETGSADHYAHALNYAEIGLKVLDPSLHVSDDMRG